MTGAFMGNVMIVQALQLTVNSKSTASPLATNLKWLSLRSKMAVLSPPGTRSHKITPAMRSMLNALMPMAIPMEVNFMSIQEQKMTNSSRMSPFSAMAAL